MRCGLLITGIILCFVALRGEKMRVQKSTAHRLLILGSLFLIFGFTGSFLVAVVGAGLWLLLPLLDLMGYARKINILKRYRLRSTEVPCSEYFLSATQAQEKMEESGFEHVDDLSLCCSGMKQYLRLFWNPEVRSVAVLSLCVKEECTFSYISLISRHPSGEIWSTGNHPFGPILRDETHVKSYNTSSQCCCFGELFQIHQRRLNQAKNQLEDFLMPDPDLIGAQLERDMAEKVRYNLEMGILREVSECSAVYSFKGVMYLWTLHVKALFCLRS